VFHGGSGSEKAKITEAVSYGVFKMNIDTDTQFAFAEPVGAYVEANAVAFTHQIDPSNGKPTRRSSTTRASGCARPRRAS
jgi:fructose-bisphosphate aldolase class II